VRRKFLYIFEQNLNMAPITTSKAFYQILSDKFPHDLTEEQALVMSQLTDFIMLPSGPEIFILRGHAGTGKTSIISTLVSNLWHVQKKAVLLAPTGRAAKVISNYSGMEASTIHRFIYFPRTDKGGGVKFVLQPNKNRKTIFFVDESSMISDGSNEFTGDGSSLLDDLIQFVFSGHQCKLVFIGDTAQLPPVKLDLSPALESLYFETNYGKQVHSADLTQVMRQQLESGILYNATEVRREIQNDGSGQIKMLLKGFKDIIRLEDGNDVLDALNDSYSNVGNENTAIIVRSNKRANLYNQQIRTRILFNEAQLSVGDYLMVVKNNYFWVKPETEAAFIANGDTIEVLEIYKFESFYGFDFARVKVRLVDYPKMKPFETVLLLNTISSETPALTYEENNQLYNAVKEDYVGESSNYKRFLKIKQNPHFNALQVKFSYAMTCHKSQGGQWHTVFIEQPYLPEGPDLNYYRWLYTAMTRAQNRLYLLGFDSNYFDDEVGLEKRNY